MACNELAERFLKSAGINNCDDFDLSFISSVKSSFDKNFFTFYIEKNDGWTFSLLERFISALHNITKYKYKIIFSYKNSIKNDVLKQLIYDWYFNNYHANPSFEIEFSQDSNSKDLKFIFENSECKDAFSKCIVDLNSFLQFINYDFEIHLNDDVGEEINKKVISHEVDKSEPVLEIDNSSNKESLLSNNGELLFSEIKKKTEEEIALELKENAEKMVNDRENNLFKKGGYIPLKIAQIDTNSEGVDINGRIFELTGRESRTGKFILNIGLDDDTDAIYVTFISNARSLKREDLMTLAVGQNLRVEGRVGIDKFKKETMVMGHLFFQLPPDPLRDDTSPEKRVELHLHTKMSDMDGVSFFADYVKLAKHMGHSAIAITDHGNVQGYPDAQAVAKKAGMKVIYGSELYVIDDYIHASVNADDSLLNNENYVCLDTETTGLSTKYDRITEFGAVKVVKGIVTERLDILINPEIPIPLEIQEKTNISEEMIKDQPTIKEAFPQILKFMEGSIMVSHNIDFDYGMINEEMKRNGFGELKVRGIDTLALSRHLFPESNAHNLGALCKRLEVEYNDTKAHRADYDAEVLANAWMTIRASLVKKSPSISLKDLENLPIEQAALRRYRNNYHAVVLVKDDLGVKDLYKIISDARINRMGFRPFTTKSFLNSHREHLLIGSACFNGEVFQNALLRDDESVREAIKQFDYIEIQPLENYSYLINMHQIPNEDRLKEMLRNIIRIAKEEKKIIVATGDCHYRDPKDKIYRDVIISAKQVGNNDHPLKPYNRSNYPEFENPDQHFRGTDEMLKCFDWIDSKDAYEFVVTNSNLIANMCQSIVPVKTNTYTPKIENSEKLLSDLVYDNAHRLYGEHLPEIIESRIKSELNGIIDNGYSVIYYIAYQLVKKANDDGYIVGSRGSVGSSLVATLSDITEVNPLPPHYRCPHCKHVEFYEEDPSMSGFDLSSKKCPECGTEMIGDGQSIPFQTFLGFNADKTPDIDLNFATDYQSKAHDYTKVLLGASNVFRAGTISAVQQKTAYGYVRKYFEDVLHQDPDTVHRSRIASIAYGCTEIKRTTGQHPAGIVVVPSEYDVYDFTPIQYPADDITAAWKTTHFDFTSMHDTLLKLDILGHVDPQAIKMMCDITGVDIKSIPVNDKDVLSLFTDDASLHLQHKYMKKDNGALGLPEFGTDFVRQVLRESQPKTFKDLVIISGLTHGTDVWNNNAQDLIKNGITNLEGVIGCRDDIMTYLISKGLDPHNSFVIMETVRKKDKQLNPEQIKDMLDHKVPDYYIESCKKIKYLFPKGHATAYVMMALRVGYFKVHYPLEYYASFFTLRSDEYDIASMIGGIDKIEEKLQELYQRRSSGNPEDKLSVKEEAMITTLEVALEMTERGYKFDNISLEKSEANAFTIDKENNALIPPFKVLNGVGTSASETLINARKEKPFSSREDFVKRGGFSSTNVKELDALGVLKDLKDSDQLSLFDFSF